MKKPDSPFSREQQKSETDSSIKVDRFENEIEVFRRLDKRNSIPEKPVLFIGSSSIVYWETSESFPEFPVINRGFGGASIAEINHYYDDIIKKYTPSVLVVYCDIDIENGKSPEVTSDAFRELVKRVKGDFPVTQIILLSVKPALIDNFLGRDVRRNKIAVNKLLSEYCNNERNLHFVDLYTPLLKPDGNLRTDIFLRDGMHLNNSGYELWRSVLKDKIADLYR